MHQLIQSFSDGKISIEELPVPQCSVNGVVSKTKYTLISAGTEKMLLEFGRAGLLGKVTQQPEKVKLVLDKIKTDGLLTTIDAVNAKLELPTNLGYCNVGVVVEVGSNVKNITIGDRIISNGPHAEYVAVNKNLIAKVPNNVTDDSAVFAIIASIALQGIRLAKPTIGEKIVVTGLGLIGLLTVQLLKANGCNVLGIDPDPEKTRLAKLFGAEVVNIDLENNSIEVAKLFSNGKGVDAVILTLSSKSNKPIKEAATMCRKRGRIVLVGVTDLNIDRADFYEKEITFQVSCSYGPGRYDQNYEVEGNDYPIGYVRWTEQRNFEAILNLMSDRSISTDQLITHNYNFEDAKAAYDMLLANKEWNLGVILKYDLGSLKKEKEVIQLEAQYTNQSDVSVGFIGAGNYSGKVLIPNLKKLSVDLQIIANRGSVNATYYAKKFGFKKITTNNKNVFNCIDINTIFVATRHDSHADLVIKALDASKNIFCEKPLAINIDQLQLLDAAYKNAIKKNKYSPKLMVGFNRRFSPLIERVERLLQNEMSPKVIIMTVNAGEIDSDSWVQSKEIGGGRIIGEACHFIDLARFLSKSKITKWDVFGMKKSSFNDDKVIINLQFEDGSIGVINYLANGHKSFDKERIEIFCAGKIVQLNNFKSLKTWGCNGYSKTLLKQNKGNNECIKSFVNSILTGQSAPISYEELYEVSKIAIEIAEILRN